MSNISKNKFIMKLYNNIDDILKKIKKNNIKKNIIIKDIDNNPLNYLKNNDFTSDNIKNVIINKLKICNLFSFENNDIIYFTEKKYRDLSKDLSKNIPKIIIYMFSIIKLLKELFKKTDYQKIIYFETKEKKKLPNKKITLGPNEVNSGVTFLNSIHNHKSDNPIFLFRKEEVIKVLIHELIHSNLIDERIILTNFDYKLNNKFCVNYKILLNEAFTETFATIINMFYININNRVGRKNLNEMFENELNYSDSICLKIMKYYNIKNIDEIIKKNNTCDKFFLQNTNILSYYFLKNILLKKHILFGKILDKNTINYKIINNKGILELIDLIFNNIYLLQNKNNILINKSKSLRLCYYELKI